MKQLKRASVLSLLALAFVCAGAVGAARADVRDLRVISARAGGVNLVSGDVKVRRAASAEWVALSAADELKSGDTVRTGPTGRIEILLNPGSYFRAGADTKFTLASADLNELRVALARGGAVVEATGYEDMDLAIEVLVPGALVKIVRSGVYRLNVPAAGPSEVVVAKGRALVGSTVVKGGKVALVSAAGVEVAKLDKKWRDDLDQWSRERGKELARANERLSRRVVRSAFLNGFDSFSASRSSYGYWFYNAALRCYTFLPYGYGWRSPYGYGYGTGLYGPRAYPGGWSPGYNPSGGYNPGGGGGMGSPGGGGPKTGGHRPVSPPNINPPSRGGGMIERPMREKTYEPGSSRP